MTGFAEYMRLGRWTFDCFDPLSILFFSRGKKPGSLDLKQKGLSFWDNPFLFPAKCKAL
jgi:hypothetical protein